METLVHNHHLLDPSHYGAFSWKLISHKICRWMVPPSAICGIAGLLLLGQAYAWAHWMLGAALIGALVAAIGAFWPSSRPLPRAISLLAFAAAANVAVVHALFRLLHGHEDHLWEPTRRAPAAGE